ncbi:MAG: sugar phosphate isomerase/epimerase [Victivallaceae bacterium]|nr:sugar phosphate isomerase/epimerase [Victivallaceae bacterium]
MFLTGFTDEASADFAKQIEATKLLHWKNIESRTIGTGNLASISDAEFAKVQQLLDESGVKINCFGSGIANWSKHPRKEEDFQSSREELLKAIPRMKQLGTKMVRGMSFLVPTDEDPQSPELEKIIFAKVTELAKICEDNGIIYGHENCMNYGGMSYEHTLKLLENVKSPAFQLIFDTGNPVFALNRIGAKPYRSRQSAWEFYSKVKEFIVYVHIKDATALIGDDGKVSAPKFCYAGDGEGDVRAIVLDLLRSGYDGGFSMEPHLATVFHAKDDPADDGTAKQRRFETYVEYCRRFERLLAECRG